ncbi:MAG: DUF3857 domain-containing protein [Cyclobacteriaceae bacterium]
MSAGQLFLIGWILFQLLNQKQKKTALIITLILKDKFTYQNKPPFTITGTRCSLQKGVQEMSDISIEFDPSFQKLVIHKIEIERNIKFINQLDLNKVTTASTESTKERHLYDGSMTALIHLDGVQKGDIIAV